MFLQAIVGEDRRHWLLLPFLPPASIMFPGFLFSKIVQPEVFSKESSLCYQWKETKCSKEKSKRLAHKILQMLALSSFLWVRNASSALSSEGISCQQNNKPMKTQPKEWAELLVCGWVWIQFVMNLPKWIFPTPRFLKLALDANRTIFIYFAAKELGLWGTSRLIRASKSPFLTFATKQLLLPPNFHS